MKFRFDALAELVIFCVVFTALIFLKGSSFDPSGIIIIGLLLMGSVILMVQVWRARRIREDVANIMNNRWESMTPKCLRSWAFGESKKQEPRD